jgi:Cu2+-exporting ATPase/Cu+-exporting ATPase
MKCFHCNDIYLTAEEIKFNNKGFCCNGCVTVFKILHSSGLEEYYNLKDDQVNKYVREECSQHLYLDHLDFQNEYVRSIDGIKTFKFYIEGIHCSACLWILEKLNKIIPEVTSSRLDMGSSILEVKFLADGKLSEIATKLEQIGYPAHPILNQDNEDKHRIKENKQDLLRIGVAFACAGNIMLYSLAVYFGAPKDFAQYFNLFSFFCTIPIMFYCAKPFYISTLRSFKLRQISIDVPIVLVLILSFFLGLFSLLTDSHFYYFDTISTLVFLLLFSRYLLKIVQNKSLTFNQVSTNYANQIALKKNSSGYEEILAKYIIKEDELLVRAGTIIPSDGIILSGESFVNNAILTGESRPSRVSEGDVVFMGAQNLESDLHMVASSSTKLSRMGQILENIEANWRQDTSFSGIVEGISKYFTIIVLNLSALFFLYFLYIEGIDVAINNTFSLLLITCPCALAISTPLALLVGLGVMLKNKVFIKDEKSLEKILNVKNIFFDKTGTLTDGKFKLLIDMHDRENLSILMALESRSTHPIGRSIFATLDKLNLMPLEVSEFREIRGEGVRGVINGEEYSVKKISSSGLENRIGLYHQGVVLIEFTVDDQMIFGIDKTIRDLKQMGLNVFILSGDKKQRVLELGSLVGVEEKNCLWEMSPENKLSIIEKTENSMMIGDGVNDSAAIQLALVGVAVNGSAESSMKACDIYIAKGGAQRLASIISSAKNIFRIIKRNLFISLAYNLLGIYLAFNGIVSPVVAAIFMPLSSLTVVLSTVFSVKRINILINKI